MFVAIGNETDATEAGEDKGGGVIGNPRGAGWRDDCLSRASKDLEGAARPASLLPRLPRDAKQETAVEQEDDTTRQPEDEGTEKEAGEVAGLF